MALRKRKGEPQTLEYMAYDAIRTLLHVYTVRQSWMSTDLILGIVQSGIDEATREFLIKRIKRR